MSLLLAATDIFQQDGAPVHNAHGDLGMVPGGSLSALPMASGPPGAQTVTPRTARFMAFVEIFK